MNKKNRIDTRSLEEFKAEIAQRTLIERKLFLEWLDLQEKETGVRPEFTDTGCGNHGEYIEDSKVSTAADFNVDGFGLIEVKFAAPMLAKFFHLKIGQTKSYIKQGASILMVMGASEETPKFTFIGKESLEEIAESSPVVRWIGFGWKPAYRVNINKFVWRDLK